MSTAQVINGIDVGELKEKVQAFADHPELGESHFRVRNHWLGKGHNRTEISGFYAAGDEQVHEHTHVVDNDEPPLLLSGDEGPNPVENLLHALAGCVSTSLIYHAAARGIEIRSLDTQIEGDIDLRGFMGVDESIPKGYQEIRVILRADSDAPPEKLAELAQYSPVFNTITHGAPVKIQVELK